jgi:hypothetical protein
MRRLFALILFCFCSLALADTEATPRQRVTVSDSGRYIFKMVPEQKNEQWETIRQPYGVAYEIKDNGSFRELWRVKGWYEFSTELSDDGRHLVRVNGWPRGGGVSKENLAIAFYDRGKLLAQYSTADLIKDATRVFATVSHYEWLANTGCGADFSASSPYLTADNLFILETVDGISYTFDITTGKITHTEIRYLPPKPAPTGQ